MQYKILISLILFFTTFKAWGAIDLSASQTNLMNFRNIVSSRNPDDKAYQSLYAAAQGFTSAVAGERSDSEIYTKCKIALKEIYPRLADAAYYYASKGNQEEVLKYACMYVDVAIQPCLSKDSLMLSPRFGTLANLAATNMFNRRQYDSSIRYFEAYLESKDPASREIAFEGLSRCHFEQKAYGAAANIAYQGAIEYPNNWNILVIGIEAAGYNGNDLEMGELLEKALRLQPEHIGLLEYQGKLYERQRKYDKATHSFARLCALPGATLDHITHLGFDCYNAATLIYVRAKKNGDERAMNEAKMLYKKSAAQLQTVLNNTPYAANVARALAFCYSVNNEAVRLEETNRVLNNLNVPKVDYSALPTLVQSYTPSLNYATAAQSTTVDIANGVEEKIISDVDINIPTVGLLNENTLALIISNENYANKVTSKVDFALRDGEMMVEYCKKVLGIPEDRVKYYPDATYLNMKQAFSNIKDLTDIKPGMFNVIFFYAGHGMPDQIGENSYLVPIDSDGRNPESMFALDKLYADFDKMKTKNITVFLDACFSGQGRDGRSIYSARYVARDAADVAAKGHTVVFSAGTGSQLANPYKEKGHGFFTYFLLKALQESRGKITLETLSQKLSENVAFEVQNKLGATQTPTVKASEALGSTWKSRNLFD
ncbi:MAG: caspase family protein [Paramuribaculum sp.]|nr:caspase family protein [Paramuribaculum sp.]